MIIDLQRRLAEAGRIRIGQRVPTGNGRSRPAKLDRFRLTSGDKLRIEQAAETFGGQLEPWDSPAGPAWQVITDATSLNVIVPPTDMAFSQHFELWSAGGCQRRCDGRTETISDSPCVCDPAARECAIHTRLSVMLADLAGLGVWRLDTSGYYAAVELQGAVQVIQLAAGHGRMLPARLRLDQRQVKRLVGGKPQTRNFAVPVLDVEITPGELVSTGPVATPALDVVQTPAALPSKGNLTPVPADLPRTPVGTVGDQFSAAAQAPPPPRRSNAAAPLPATGVAVRTAAQAATGDDTDDGPAAEPAEPSGDTITSAQTKKMGALMREHGLTDRDTALIFVATTIGREVSSRSDLTKAEASSVIDALQRVPQGVDTDTGEVHDAGQVG